MKLADYLYNKLLQYKGRVAFKNTGVTYDEILPLFEGIKSDQGGQVSFCEGKNKEVQALNILQSIAKGHIVVPLCHEYGDKYNDYIRKVCTDTQEDLEGVAAIAFTSGTKGLPKGIMLTDRNIISNLDYIDNYFNVEGLKRICISRPLSHIAVLTSELLFSLCHGLEVYFYEGPFLPNRLLKYLEDNSIDIYCATPTIYNLLGGIASRNISSLKIGVISGEPLMEDIGKNISSAFPNTKFYHVYGLSEHSPRVCASNPILFQKKPNSIGKPIGNVEMKIVNNELVVRSPCVMKGYLNDSHQTNQVIQDGWLYTGDLAHKDEDGNFYIDARKDDMICCAGINVYPTAIEEFLGRQREIKGCVVFGETYNGRTVIKIIYQGDVSPLAVRKILQQFTIPDSISIRIERVENFQYTLSGKKIRK